MADTPPATEKCIHGSGPGGVEGTDVPGTAVKWVVRATSRPPGSSPRVDIITVFIFQMKKLRGQDYRPFCLGKCLGFRERTVSLSRC